MLVSSTVGFNQSKADENSKTVLITSMTAKQVNINTQAHTQLTGSLIAATDTVGFGFRIGFRIGFRLEIGLGLGIGIVLVDVGYLDIATA
jgi:hypothetical protein